MKFDLLTGVLHWFYWNKLPTALGMRDQLEIDIHKLSVTTGDIFLLVTDRVYRRAKPDTVDDR
jgi:serine/threonine protein phosphatase PrpC